MNRLRGLLAGIAIVVAAAGAACLAAADDQVEGCGYLSNEGGCLHLVMPDSSRYELDDTYSYSAGDTVFVYGRVLPHCTPTCQAATACLGALLGPCAVVDYGCGPLVDCGEDPGQCACIQTRSGRLVDLTTLGGFDLGDSVHVTGYPLCCPVTWCAFNEMTHVETIVSCRNPDPVLRTSWGRVKSIFRESR